jgi:L-ascorbate metabolism protein UlaG (beta-lactamase superfamily)
MRSSLTALIIITVFFVSFARGGEGNITIEEIAREKLHHRADGTFSNPWCIDCGKGFLDLLKWRFSRNSFRELRKRVVGLQVKTPDFERLAGTPGDYMVWLGHSTVLMRVGGKTILTDPVFGDVNFLIRRKTPFPIEPEKFPRVDYVLISHAHYDHLNTETIESLRDRFDPFFVTGPGYGAYFASIGTSKHVVVDWWETHRAASVLITSLPVQHWSKRWFNDTNRSLWSSFLIEAGGRKYYWVGDSGYYRGFSEIGEKFGPIDVLFVPVGSYEPRWFMKTNHMNPEEAVRVAGDVRAKTFIPIHWGTFDLTDEPVWFPVERLKKLYKGVESPKLVVLDHGGHFRVGD